MKAVLVATAASSVAAIAIAKKEVQKSGVYKRCPVLEGAKNNKAKASLLAKMANSKAKHYPGIGMDLDKVKKGMGQVYKDGYYKVGCVNDAMRIFADKHGDGKFKFKDSDVSIVWYDTLTPKEDAKEMTPEICYNFCRTIDGMTFFGLNNGRGCYCTPYYKPTVGGEGEVCAAPCDGDSTQMCGGKTKSDIYQMHWCGDVVANLNSAVELLTTQSGELSTASVNLKTCLDSLQEKGNTKQEMVASNGDKYMGDWAQAMKVQAGVYQKMVTAADKLVGGSTEATMIGNDLASKDSAIPENAAAAEKVLADIDVLEALVNDAEDDTAEAAEACTAEATSESRLTEEYFSVAKWVAPGFEETSTSCGGEPIGAPSMRTPAACAELCDKTVSPAKCMAFQAIDGACVLLSKVTGVSYYAGEQCQNIPAYQCMVKMSESTGFSAPAEKQDRCFA